MIRVFDCLVAAVLLLVTIPILLLTAIAVRCSSPGPIFYLAPRVGRGGKPFRMYKFRTMHVSKNGPEITATNDARIFAGGKMIRLLKLDEIPQLLNVLKGDMAIVGPRPEAPAIVEAHYDDWMHATLEVPPGITSPGTIFYYYVSDEILDEDDAEVAYLTNLLGPKLAVDADYLNKTSLGRNIVVIAQTVIAILGRGLGMRFGFGYCDDRDRQSKHLQ